LSWKDSIITPWFTNVYEFYKLVTQQRLNFGCVITDKDNEKCNVKDGQHFVQLALPPEYMFCPTKVNKIGEGIGKVEEKKETQELPQSGMISLIFIFDFCVMLHNVAFDKNGKVIGNITFDENGRVKGMGTKIPERKQTFN
jgi:hypothetical protein